MATLSTANSLTGGVELHEEAVLQLRTAAKATKAKAIFAPPMIGKEILKSCPLAQGPFYMDPYLNVAGLLKPYQPEQFFASHLLSALQITFCLTSTCNLVEVTILYVHKYKAVSFALRVS